MITTIAAEIDILIELPAGSGQDYPADSIVVRTTNTLVKREFSPGEVSVTTTPALVTDGSISISGLPVEPGLTTVEVFTLSGSGSTENYSRLLTDSVDRITPTTLITQVLF